MTCQSIFDSHRLFYTYTSSWIRRKAVLHSCTINYNITTIHRNKRFVIINMQHFEMKNSSASEHLLFRAPYWAAFEQHSNQYIYIKRTTFTIIAFKLCVGISWSWLVINDWFKAKVSMGFVRMIEGMDPLQCMLCIDEWFIRFESRIFI